MSVSVPMIEPFLSRVWIQPLELVGQFIRVVDDVLDRTRHRHHLRNLSRARMAWTTMAWLTGSSSNPCGRALLGITGYITSGHVEIDARQARIRALLRSCTRVTGRRRQLSVHVGHA